MVTPDSSSDGVPQPNAHRNYSRDAIAHYQHHTTLEEKNLVWLLQADRRRVLEGLSEAELKDRIEKLQLELGRRFGEESEDGLGSRMLATRQ